MNVGAKLLQLFLVRDPETLLLVDDDEAEILELRALRQDRVRADDNVDRTIGKAFAGLGQFLGRDEARQAADL